MKNIVLFVFLSFLCISGIFAQEQIVVKNTADFDRTAEMVEVKVGKKNTVFLNKQFVLKNEKGKEVAYQLVFDKNKTVSCFIFQADVKAKSTVTYQVGEGKPSAVKFLTHARFVPERKDDFAWENDLAAYRMYGPALAKENPSNGVDLWLKRTSDTIVSKRYRDELQNGLTYHVDRGNGLDCYKVGHTLGAGGIAPYQAGKLFVGDYYNRFEIKENGPLRSVFTLYYDKVKVGNETVSQEITITTNAGSTLNKAVVKYSGNAQPFQLAAGIFTHDEKGVKYSNLKTGTIAYAEDAVSDAKIPSGRNYVGVLIPFKAKTIANQDNHLLITANYKDESTFTYYFGGGWSKWQFPTDKDWFEAVEKFSKQIKQPLKVKVK
jgi:uncharacterized lipoprotein NlpE involved in copper resistance